MSRLTIDWLLILWPLNWSLRQATRSERTTLMRPKLHPKPLAVFTGLFA